MKLNRLMSSLMAPTVALTLLGGAMIDANAASAAERSSAVSQDAAGLPVIVVVTDGEPPVNSGIFYDRKSRRDKLS